MRTVLCGPLTASRVRGKYYTSIVQLYTYLGATNPSASFSRCFKPVSQHVMKKICPFGVNIVMCDDLMMPDLIGGNSLLLKIHKFYILSLSRKESSLHCFIVVISYPSLPPRPPTICIDMRRKKAMHR